MEPEARVAPSGEKATLVTIAVCPMSTKEEAPVVTFHRRTVLSTEPEASV